MENIILQIYFVKSGMFSVKHAQCVNKISELALYLNNRNRVFKHALLTPETLLPPMKLLFVLIVQQQ